MACTLHALVLGFDVFSSRGSLVVHNPAALVARQLDGTNVDGVCVRGEVIPVSYRYVTDELGKLLKQRRWDCVVGLGLNPSASVPSIELAAANVAGPPDFYGYVPRDGRLYSDAPLGAVEALPVNVEVLKRCLTERGFSDAKLSVTAGTYLCNALAYTLYRWGRVSRVPTVFVHIPPAGDVAEELGVRSYGLAVLREFVTALLACTCGGQSR